MESQQYDKPLSSGFWLQLVALLLFSGLLAGCGGGSDNSDSGSGNLDEIVMRSGPIQAVRVGESVSLDGSKSYMTTADSETTLGASSLQFDWSFTHLPQNSQTVLRNSTTMNPGFTPDTSGVYIYQVIGRGNGLTSPRSVGTVVASLEAESLSGKFNHQGLSNYCADCHDGSLDSAGSERKIRGKSGSHGATSQVCVACHTPQDFATIPFVDHQEVFGDCSGCHNGQIAVGMSEFHIETTAECNDCHDTTSFLALDENGNFDHSTVVRVCSGCHNGTVAIGMSATISQGGSHPDTTTECGFCHTTESFLNPYPDHTGPEVVGKRCDSCHNGSTASGYPSGHPTMRVDCEVCHSITGFNMGGVFNHALVDPATQPCADCHTGNNSINAIGMDADHLNTSSDCGACHSTSPQPFSPAFGIDHTDPAVSAQRCDNCHVGRGNTPGTGGVAATGTADAPHTHMPFTGRDCSDCHQTGGTFATGSFDHDGNTITTGCESCHDNDITLGKLETHFPTTALCETCHNTTAFAPETLDHNGITSGCASCHDGNYNAPGKATLHVPTSDDCSVCHTTTAFSPSTFSHSGITSGCYSCHDGTYSSIGSNGAKAKPVNHIPASNVCEDCHTSTSAFTPQDLDHSGITQGCAGCHNSSFPAAPDHSDAPQPLGHIPTSDDCNSCHSTSGWTPILAHTTTHAGINSNCSSCHDGSFTSLGAVAKDSGHITTTGDCRVCHSKSAFSPAFVDHSSSAVQGQRCDACHDGTTATGKADDPTPPHPSTTQDCGSCHQAGGAFSPASFDHSGVVDNCASCHQGRSVNGITGKADDPSPPHPTTSEDCSVCHNTTSFANAQYDHSRITITQNPPSADPTCGSCHNGTTAPGKTPPAGHVPTNEDCVVCHQTSGFTPASFSHDGIVDNCSSCHGAGYAQGKPTSHVLTTEDCGVCHNTTTFTGAVYDHSGITDNCASCHDGSTARGKSTGHLATTLDCHLCHTTATFADGSWVHDSSTAGTCDTCHDGSSARGKPSGHLSTTSQCDVCHSTSAWQPDIFSHDPNGDYPGDHSRNLSCSQCHGSVISSTIPWPYSQYEPNCAACHANDFRSEDDHIGGKNGTVAQNQNCGQSGCHRVSSREW